MSDENRKICLPREISCIDSILTLKPRPISTSASTGNVKSRLETTKLFVHAQST